MTGLSCSSDCSFLVKTTTCDATLTESGWKNLKILHILNDGPSVLSDRIIKVQSEEHELVIVDLTKDDVSYEDLVDKICSCDRVESW